MNRAQLRAFHAVASEGSFTRAAAVLRVTQPTLSGQVKALEETYGVLLFDRRGRRVQTTEMGRALLEITRRLFGLEAEAEQLLAAARGLRRGHLRVGADAPHHVMESVAAFSRIYPGVRLSISIGNSQELVQELLEHRSDVAVVADALADPRLTALPLRRDRLIAFVERSHPLARRRNIGLEHVARERLVLRERGSATRRVIETALARAGLAPSEVLEIGSREAVREAVAAGLGLGVVSESEFGRHDRLKRLPITDADLSTTEYAVCLSDRRELRLVRAFLDLVRAQPAAR